MIEFIEYWTDIFNRWYGLCESRIGIDRTEFTIYKSALFPSGREEKIYRYVHDDIVIISEVGYNPDKTIDYVVFKVSQKNINDEKNKNIIYFYKSLNTIKNNFKITHVLGDYFTLDVVKHNDVFIDVIDDQSNTTVINYDDINTSEKYFQQSCLYNLPSMELINDIKNIHEKYSKYNNQITLYYKENLEYKDFIPKE